MPKPKIIKSTHTPDYVGLPEHNFRLKSDEWDLVVFDNAVKFSVSWFRGRGNRGRTDYTDFPTAVIECLKNERACLYASTGSGRSACLERAKFDALRIRWDAKNKTVES